MVSAILSRQKTPMAEKSPINIFWAVSDFFFEERTSRMTPDRAIIAVRRLRKARRDVNISIMFFNREGRGLSAGD